jgi:hypothetical protein
VFIIEQINRVDTFDGHAQKINNMAEEKGVTSVQRDCTPDTSDAATFMSLWDNGFILRNAGEYLSLFEVSQFLTTCTEWKRMFKSTIEPIKCFWEAAAVRVYGRKITDNPQLSGGLTHFEKFTVTT